MPNVGLTAAFAAPQASRVLSRTSGTPLPLSSRPSSRAQYYGTVLTLRREPWKEAPRLDSRDLRQKRAEAAAQRLAGLGCSRGMGEREIRR